MTASLVAVCLLPVFMVCLLTLAVGAAVQLVDVAHSLRRRHHRRQMQRAIAEYVRAVREEAQELGRIACAAQVVHAHHVFALHRERQEGIRARA